MKKILYTALLLYLFFIICYTVIGRVIRKRRYAKIIKEYQIKFQTGDAVITKRRKRFHKK